MAELYSKKRRLLEAFSEESNETVTKRILNEQKENKLFDKTKFSVGQIEEMIKIMDELMNNNLANIQFNKDMPYLKDSSSVENIVNFCRKNQIQLIRNLLHEICDIQPQNETVSRKLQIFERDLKDILLNEQSSTSEKLKIDGNAEKENEMTTRSQIMYIEPSSSSKITQNQLQVPINSNEISSTSGLHHTQVASTSKLFQQNSIQGKCNKRKQTFVKAELNYENVATQYEQKETIRTHTDEHSQLNASSHSKKNEIKNQVNIIENRKITNALLPKLCPNKNVFNDEDLVKIGPNGTLVKVKVLRQTNWMETNRATRKLLMSVFSRATLATHTLTGKESPAFKNCGKQLKNPLNPKKVFDIIDVIKKAVEAPTRDIRSAITTKCADECKMYKSRQEKIKLKEKEQLRKEEKFMNEKRKLK